MQAATTSPPQTDNSTHHAPHQRGALDRELFCPRLQRLLMGAASELGHRGNLAQVVASIERGGAGGGGEDPNLSMLRRLGVTDRSWISGKAGQLYALEQQLGRLSAKHQATALAHYLGTPRAHATLRERFGAGQGGLAGVVLYRWRQKQAKLRDRGAVVGGAKLGEQLERVRAELAPLERELATVTAVLDASLPEAEPRPVRPPEPEQPPYVLRGAIRDRELAEYWRPYRAACRVWSERDDVKALRAAQGARRAAGERLAELVPLLPPLQAEQSRLCAQLADAAGTMTATDDEEALVRVCRSGNLDAEAHLGPAEADVRAMHRAWQAAGKSLARQHAKEWLDGEGATA